MTITGVTEILAWLGQTLGKPMIWSTIPGWLKLWGSIALLYGYVERLAASRLVWTLGSTEGYRLSIPIGTKITHLLYTYDLKVFASTEAKLKRVPRSTSTTMQDTVRAYTGTLKDAFISRRVRVQDAVGTKLDHWSVVESLKPGTS